MAQRDKESEERATLAALADRLLDDGDGRDPLSLVAEGARWSAGASCAWVTTGDGRGRVVPAGAGDRPGTDVDPDSTGIDLLHRGPALVDEPAAGPVPACLAGLDLGPTLVVPIEWRARRFGTLVVANRRGEPDLGADDLASVTRFAREAATLLALGERGAAPGAGPAGAPTTGEASRPRRDPVRAEPDDGPDAEAVRALLPTVAHEMRNPLTSIVSFSRLLLDEPDPGDHLDTAREYLDVIHRNANRLLRLVGDLSTLAHLESGQLRLELGPVILTELVDDAVSASSATAAERGVTLESTVDAGPPVRGDFDRLVQLLDNLVSNAVKYSTAGGTVAVCARHGDGTWLLQVTDTGIGIPAGEVHRVGEQFFRGTNGRQVAGGTGLGLSIVQAIAELHGGHVSITSRLHRGTTVTVEFPEAP